MEARRPYEPDPMQYQGVEYSVIQSTDGVGWRWEIRLADGRRKIGVTPISRAAAIKLAKHEIDRALSGRSNGSLVIPYCHRLEPAKFLPTKP